MYTFLTFILAVIGGSIFSACEYDHESDQIEKKIYYYKKIQSALPDNMQSDLDKLLSMCTVPTDHGKNRWDLKRSTFFAFTTASTIGYGFTTPETYWGRFATFLYGLPAICLFGVGMVQMGSAVTYKVDQYISQRSLQKKRQCSCISFELRRTLFLFGILMLLIVVSGHIFALLQDDWTYDDGAYFMWISISTIGYGDLQPNVIEKTVWANFIIWIGLALTALLIGAAQDYFQKKLKKWRQENENEGGVSGDGNENGKYEMMNEPLLDDENEKEQQT